MKETSSLLSRSQGFPKAPRITDRICRSSNMSSRCRVSDYRRRRRSMLRRAYLLYSRNELAGSIFQSWNEGEQRRLEFQEQLRAGQGTGLSMREINLLYDMRERGLVDDDSIYRIAASRELSEYLGFDFDFIYNNYDAMWQLVADDRENRYQLPKSRWEAIKNITQVAWNTVPLGRMGNELHALNNRILRAADENERAALQQQADELWDQIKEIQKTNEELSRGIPTDALTTIITSTIQSAPLTLRSSLGGIGGGLLGGGIGALIGGPAGLAAGFKAGYGLGSFAASSVEMAGLMYIDLLSAGVEQENAARLAVLGGSLNGFIESGLGLVAGWGASLGRTVAGAVLSNEARARVADIAAKNLITRIAQTVKSSAFGRNLLTRTIFDIGVQTIGEGIEEGLQYMVEQGMLAVADAMQLDPVERNEFFDSDYGRELLQSMIGGLAGGIGFGIFGLPMTITGNIQQTARQTAELKNLAVTIDNETEFIPAARENGLTENMTDAQLREIYQNQEGVRQEYLSEETRIAMELGSTAGLGEGYAESRTDPETGETIPLGETFRHTNGLLHTELDERRGLFKIGDPRVESSTNLYSHISYSLGDNGTVQINEFRVRNDLDSPQFRSEAFARFAETFAGQNIIWDVKTTIEAEIREALIQNNPQGEQAGLNYFINSQNIEGGRYRNMVMDNFKKYFPQYNNAEHSVMTSVEELIANLEGRTLEEHINRQYGGIDGMFTRQANRRVDAAMKEGQKIKGAVTFESSARDAKAVIYLSKNADLSTYIHEVGHIIRRRLSEGLLKQAEQAFGVKDGNWNGETINAEGRQTTYEEVFTEALERYLRDGYAPAPEIKSLFQKIAEFLAKIINEISRRTAVSPEIKEFFDNYFTGGTDTSATAQNAQDNAGNSYEANKKYNEERSSLDKNNAPNDPKPRQAGITSIQELRDKAAEHIDELREWVNSIAEKYEARVIERKVSDDNPLPLKREERIQEKLDAGDHITEILDVMGMTIAVKDFKNLVEIAAELRERNDVLRVKDRFKPIDKFGYKDILINVQLSDGMIAEVQINTEQMIDAKSKYGGHKIYEIARGLGSDEQDKVDFNILRELSNRFYNEALYFSLASANTNESSFDIEQLLYQISSKPTLEGRNVLSEDTSKKLLESIATGRSSTSTNSNLGSSNEGTSIVGETLVETNTSLINKPSTISIDDKTNSVKNKNEKTSEKNSAENENRIEISKTKWEDADRVIGAQDQITLQTGAVLEGRYELGEAGISTPSVDPNKNFTQSESFPVNENGTSMNVGRDYTGGFAWEAAVRMASDFDQRGMGIIVDSNGVTSSGNNRDISRRIAAKNGTDSKYISYLKSRPEQWGFTKEDVERYKHPTVYFVVNAPAVYTPLYFDQFNRSGKKSISPLENAIKMSHLIKDDIVNEFSNIMGSYDSINDLYDDVQAATGIFQSLMKRGIITENSYPDYVETMTIRGKQQERITSSGKDFLESVMLGAVLQEDSIRTLAMSPEIRKRVVKGLAPMVDNAALGEYSVIPEINHAISVAVEVQTNKKKYKSIADYAGQQELSLGQKVSTDIEVELAARLLEKTEYGFTDMMAGLNAILQEEGRGQDDMFSSTSKDDILRRYLGIKAKVNEIREANNQIIENEAAPTVERVQSAMDNAGLAKDEVGGTLFQPAYHGSPYRFDGFNTTRIGSGEGNQAYGWGLYFAGKKEIAEWYRKALQKTQSIYTLDGQVIEFNSLPWADKYAIQSLSEPDKYGNILETLEDSGVDKKNISAVAQKLKEYNGRVTFKEVEHGQLYEVDIPGDEVMLDWNKPFSEQPEQVKESLRKLFADELSDHFTRVPEYGGENLYKAIVFESRMKKAANPEQQASLLLAEYGIKGIRYLDGSSRSAREGSYNYVIFDDGDVNITQTFFQLDSQLLEDAVQYESWREFRDNFETGETTSADNTWYRSIWENAQKIFNTLFQESESEEKTTKAQELDKRFYSEADKKYLEEALRELYRIHNDQTLKPAEGENAAVNDEYQRVKRLQRRISTELPNSGSIIGMAAQVRSGNALSSTQYDRLKEWMRKNTRGFRSVLADIMEQEEYLQDLAETKDGKPAGRLADPRPDRQDIKARLKEIASIVRETDPALAREIEEGTVLYNDARISAFEAGVDAQYNESKTVLDALEKETEEDYARLANDAQRRIVAAYERMLAAREQLDTTNEKLQRMMDEEGKIAEPYIRRQRLERASYEQAFKAYDDLIAMHGKDAEVREAVARREARASERIRQTDIRRRQGAARAYRESQKNLIKRITRKISFETVSYDQAVTAKAIQRLFESVYKGINKWIGPEDRKSLRAVWSQWSTDEEFRETLIEKIRASGKQGSVNAERVELILDKQWNQITVREKRTLHLLLPATDLIQELNLKELSQDNKESVQLDIDEKNINGEIQLILGENLKRQVIGELGEELYIRIQNKPLSKWDVTEAEELARVIDRLTVEGKRELAAKKEARRILEYEYRNKILEALGNTGIVIKPDDSPEEKERKQKKQDRILKRFAAGKKNNIFNNFFDANLRRFTTAMDGGRNGIFTSLLYWNENNAYNEEQRQIAIRRSVIDKVMSENKITLDELYKEVKIPGLEGTDIDLYRVSGGKITVDDLLYMMRGYKNNETREAIMYGNLSNAAERNRASGSIEELEAFANEGHSRMMLVMSYAKTFFEKEENKKFLKLYDAIGTDYDHNGERLNRAMIDMFNKPMWRVENYVPMNRREQTGSENENRVIEDLLGINGAGQKWVNRGFTEKRINIKPGGQRPIELGLYKTWAQSVNSTEHLLAYGPKVQTLNAVFKGFHSSEVRQALQDRWGKAASDYVADTIAEMANPNPTRHRQALDNIARMLRGKTASAYLAWKTSGVLKQLATSPWPYLQEIPPHEYIAACIEVSAGAGKVNDFIREKSIYMKNRDFDPMVKLIREAVEKNDNAILSAIDKFNNVGMKGLEWVDWVCVAPGWLAVYKKEVANVAKEQEAKYRELFQKYQGKEYADVLPTIESKSNRALAEVMNEQEQDMEAVARADDAVRRMQPSSRSTDLAKLFKGRNEVANIILQFQTALNVIWQNLRYDLPLAVKQKQTWTVLGMVTGYALAGICLGLLSEGFDDDDDERERARKILFFSFTQFTDAVPVIGEHITLLAEQTITGRRSYTGQQNIFPVVQKAFGGIGNAAAAFWEEDPEKQRQRFIQAAQNVMEAAGISFGAPVSGIKELGRAAGIGDGDGEFELYWQALLGQRNK